MSVSLFTAFTHVLYIHGFNSSALSFKASVLRKRMAELRRGREFLCPELPHSPREAIALLAAAIESNATAGGEPDRELAGRLLRDSARRALRAARRSGESGGGAVRSAWRPPSGRRPICIQAFATSSRTPIWRSCRSLEVERVTPERYLLIVAPATKCWTIGPRSSGTAAAEQIVVEGGDHGFSGFEALSRPRARVLRDRCRLTGTRGRDERRTAGDNLS